jgi:ketosteroid isomerase-like protein
MRRAVVVAIALLAIACSPPAGQDAAKGDGEAHAPASGVVASTPEGVVDAFAAALRAGDEAALRRLASPDIVIAESGGVERSFDEYAGHHMPADMAFTAAITFTPQDRDVITADDMATVISRSEVSGQFRERPIHSRMMETMVLRRIDGQWHIVHIHWSSAPITNEDEH